MSHRLNPGIRGATWSLSEAFQGQDLGMRIAGLIPPYYWMADGWRPVRVSREKGVCRGGKPHSNFQSYSCPTDKEHQYIAFLVKMIAFTGV